MGATRFVNCSIVGNQAGRKVVAFFFGRFLALAIRLWGNTAGTKFMLTRKCSANYTFNPASHRHHMVPTTKTDNVPTRTGDNIAGQMTTSLQSRIPVNMASASALIIQPQICWVMQVGSTDMGAYEFAISEALESFTVSGGQGTSPYCIFRLKWRNG